MNMLAKNLFVFAGSIAVGMAFARSTEALTLNNSTGLIDPAQTITFNEIELPNNTSVIDQYSSLGVEFSPNLVFETSSSPSPNITANQLKNFPPVTNPFSIHFTDKVSSAAFAFAPPPSTSTFTALLDGSVVESFSSPTHPFNSNNFFGFTDIVFDEIRIDIGEPVNSMRLDNIQFTVASTPEPSSILGLLVAGSIVTGTALKKKRST
ncbi:MAG: PEP-CTERM sorting domain-containing protein [Cyanobacteria bacterium SBLK]|nr:PEP-CTERM sorting domain-containing protein [Cyanobacteria bacterium SBLK]